jgi:hypothetical protein
MESQVSLVCPRVRKSNYCCRVRAQTRTSRFSLLVLGCEQRRAWTERFSRHLLLKSTILSGHDESGVLFNFQNSASLVLLSYGLMHKLQFFVLLESILGSTCPQKCQRGLEPDERQLSLQLSPQKIGCGVAIGAVGECEWPAPSLRLTWDLTADSCHASHRRNVPLCGILDGVTDGLIYTRSRFESLLGPNNRSQVYQLSPNRPVSSTRDGVVSALRWVLDNFLDGLGVAKKEIFASVWVQRSSLKIWNTRNQVIERWQHVDSNWATGLCQIGQPNLSRPVTWESALSTGESVQCSKCLLHDYECTVLQNLLLEVKHLCSCKLNLLRDPMPKESLT